MRYTYAVIKHQPSLGSPVSENFAVLVEGRSTNGWLVFAVGRSPEPAAPVSEVGVAIGQRFLDILNDIIIRAAEQKGPSGGLLERLHDLMVWNFHVTPAKTLEDPDPIDQVAFKLFSQHVAFAAQLVTGVGPSTGSLVARRIGETFEAAVPLPDPTLELFVNA